MSGLRSVRMSIAAAPFEFQTKISQNIGDAGSRANRIPLSEPEGKSPPPCPLYSVVLSPEEKERCTSSALSYFSS